MNIDFDALERHCRLSFATWDDGPIVNYQLGDKADNKSIRRGWDAMSENDKAYWRGLWAHLFQMEKTV